jgi:uncharacterized protein YndB with AHSA1/START domain
VTDIPEYVLERTFDAPANLVWRTWTEPKLFARWYGPNVETIVHRMDVRPGGLLHVEMIWGGNSHFQRGEYREVTPAKRLTWLHSNADAQWNIAGNPQMPDWPRVLLTDVTFSEANGKTAMRLTWTPHESTAAEIACFAGALAGLDRGWAGGMTILAEVLAEMQS